MKEKRNIQIDIDTARNWYLSKDSFKQELALKAFSKEELEKHKLPKNWREYETSLNHSSYCDAMIKYEGYLMTLKQLLVLRDVYRQGWKPDWTNTSTKYTIEYHYNNIVIDIAIYYSCSVFSFPTQELAERFLENFKEKLEQLKELL